MFTISLDFDIVWMKPKCMALKLCYKNVFQLEYIAEQKKKGKKEFIGLCV